MRELRQRVARAERSNVQLRATNERLYARVALLEKENTMLTQRCEELQRKLDDTTKHKDSLAGMIFKPNTKPKESDGRKLGGQSGHAARHRVVPEPDVRVRAYLSRCLRCEGPLPRSERTYRRRVTDIPALSRAITTEYEIEKQRCPSCAAESVAVPRGTLPGTPFGTHLVARILDLRYEARLPFNRIAGLIARDHGLTLAEATIADICGRTNPWFRPRYREIESLVAAAPVKHADETSWRTNGENGWAWAFATPRAVLYTIEETRGKGVAERILASSPPESLLVCDDYGGYRKLPLRRQSCWAHLIRVAREGDSAECRALHAQLQGMYRRLSETCAQPFDLAARKEAHRRFSDEVSAIIVLGATERDAKKVTERMRRQGDHLIEAVLHDGAPLTNNHAERQIRPLAVLRKITGGSRSGVGAAATARNMTIIQTLKLEGANLREGLRALLSSPSQQWVGEG